MADGDRRIARQLASRHMANGDPLGWFEVLYASADGDPSVIPWAELSPNPNLSGWLSRSAIMGQGHKALKIGCGLGDDAEELSRFGFDTTAFDISATAISWCQSRFPNSRVHYVEADLLDPPQEWTIGFDLVVESYTLQVLPSELRDTAMGNAARFVAPHGTLLVIARGREQSDDEGAMPWPLTRQELSVFVQAGLALAEFEDYFDDEDPPIRRFRASYTAPSSKRTEPTA